MKELYEDDKMGLVTKGRANCRAWLSRPLHSAVARAVPDLPHLKASY